MVTVLQGGKKKMPQMFELSPNSQDEQVGFAQAHQQVAPVISC